MSLPRSPLLRVWMLSLLVLAGCEAQPALSVELITDLDAGEAFDGIYVERSDASLPAVPSCTGDNVFARRDYLQGVQVSEPEKVVKGQTWTVRVTLCRGPQRIAHRAVRETIESDTELRVVIAESCVFGECGQPCDYERCEPNIECHWGDLDSCESPACGGEGQGECAPGLECVAGECLTCRSMAVEAGAADTGSGPDPMLVPDASGAFDGGEAGVTPSEAGNGDGAADASTDGDAGSADAATDGGSPWTAEHPAKLLYVGDEIAAETGRMIGFFGSALPLRLEEDSAANVAICDFLTAIPGGVAAEKKLGARVQAARPDMVIMQFWGAVTSACMAGLPPDSTAYDTRIHDDAVAAVREIEQAATAAGFPRPKILWVLQGPDLEFKERARRVNTTYYLVAAEMGDLASDAGFTVSMAAYPYEDRTAQRYDWLQFLPCYPELEGDQCEDSVYGPLARLHRSSAAELPVTFRDHVLFCTGNLREDFSCDAPALGALRYGLKILEDVKSWMGVP